MPSTPTTKEWKSPTDFLETVLEGEDCEFFWRGHRDSRWSLQPKVFRDEHDEFNLMRYFMATGPGVEPDCPRSTDFAGWLAVAQHHGLPTRLLDWSSSPLVALYFAVATSGNKSPSGDAAVWRLQPGRLTSGRGVISLENARLGASLAARFEEDKEDPRNPGKVIAVRSRHLTNRIVAQHGVFTLHFPREDGAAQPLEKNEAISGALTRYVIPEKARGDFEKLLERFRLTRDRIFPDLENLGKELSSTKTRFK